MTDVPPNSARSALAHWSQVREKAIVPANRCSVLFHPAASGDSRITGISSGNRANRRTPAFSSSQLKGKPRTKSAPASERANTFCPETAVAMIGTVRKFLIVRIAVTASRIEMRAVGRSGPGARCSGLSRIRSKASRQPSSVNSSTRTVRVQWRIARSPQTSRTSDSIKLATRRSELANSRLSVYIVVACKLRIIGRAGLRSSRRVAFWATWLEPGPSDATVSYAIAEYLPLADSLNAKKSSSPVSRKLTAL